MKTLYKNALQLQRAFLFGIVDELTFFATITH
jgi:hypothetical protein